MGTEAQIAAQKRFGAVPRETNYVDFVIAGTGTYKQQITLPLGSSRVSVAAENPVAVTGAPTTANFRAGITDGGQELVADVDLKAQGHFSNTIVAAFNNLAPAANTPTVIYLQIVVAGGTAPAGLIRAYLDFNTPNP